MRRECVRLGISFRRGRLYLTAAEMRSELASVQRMQLGSFMARGGGTPVAGPGGAAERPSNGMAADVVPRGEGALSAVGERAGQEASPGARVRGCLGKYTLRLLGQLRGKHARGSSSTRCVPLLGKYASKLKKLEKGEAAKLKKRLIEKYKSGLEQGLNEKYACQLKERLEQKHASEHETELQNTLWEM